MRILLLAPVLLAMASCTTVSMAPQVQGPAPGQWARIDCTRASAGPQVVAHFEQAKQACLSRFDAGGYSTPVVAGTSSGDQMLAAAVRSCMAERGYVWNTPTEFAARCPLPSG